MFFTDGRRQIGGLVIKHFIKRDFADHQSGWISLLGVFLFAVAFQELFLSNEFQMWPLILAGYAAGLFALVAIGKISGTILRSQHLMSRNYMLSLPINREKMFFLMQIRILVFWIPLLLIAWSAPLYSTTVVDLIKHADPFFPFVYGPSVFFLIIWFLNSTLAAQVRAQRAASRITTAFNPLKFLLIFILGMAEVGIVAGSGFGLTLLFSGGSVIGLIIVLGFAIFRYFSARTQWIGVNIQV